MIHHSTNSATFVLVIVGFLLCVDNAFENLKREFKYKRILEKKRSSGGG